MSQHAPDANATADGLYHAWRAEYRKNASVAELRIVDGMANLGFDYAAIARANRGFQNRAVRYLGLNGLDQVWDIGCGRPEKEGTNTHEILQQEIPTGRVLYMDNQPIPLVHQKAEGRSSPLSETHFVQADLRHTEELLDHARAFFDFTKPIGLLVVAVAHFLSDADDPARRIADLSRELPPDSRLVISHMTDEFNPEQARAAEAILADGGLTGRIRPLSTIEHLFMGYDLVPPGLSAVHRWNPTPADTETALVPVERIPCFGGVGIKIAS